MMKRQPPRFRQSCSFYFRGKTILPPFLVLHEQPLDVFVCSFVHLSDFSIRCTKKDRLYLSFERSSIISIAFIAEPIFSARLLLIYGLMAFSSETFREHPAGDNILLKESVLDCVKLSAITGSASLGSSAAGTVFSSESLLIMEAAIFFIFSACSGSSNIEDKREIMSSKANHP